ncbi:MAG: DUF1254 domain-containing protein [Myxococcota bacterium]|nr:DUF1254 domain-containing protein [Myxococcota bacterium]
MHNQTIAEFPSELSELTSLAAEAWIFGLPLVEHFKLFSLYRTEFSPVYRDWNEFFHVRNLMTPEMQSVVSPNTDTLMSLVLFDLRLGPALIETPKLYGRYFSLQLIDICTNSFGYIGTRTTGDAAQRTLLYLQGDTDHSQTQVDSKICSPSSLVLGICRTAVQDKADLESARALQNSIHVSTLSQKRPLSAKDIKWPTYYDVKFQSDLGFFNIMNFMMQWHNFDTNEKDLIASFSKIGVGPGKAFNTEQFSAGQLDAINIGIQQARENLESKSSKDNRSYNEWTMPHTALGNFGKEYELRALTAWNFLYANVNAEATYIRAYCDSDGERLNADEHSYEISFKDHNTPSNFFFWSLTLYDGKSYFLYKNDIKRYSIGDRTPAVANSTKAGFKVILSHEPPNETDETVWLPAPKGPFYLALRFYGLDDIDKLNLPAINKAI